MLIPYLNKMPQGVLKEFIELIWKFICQPSENSEKIEGSQKEFHGMLSKYVQVIGKNELGYRDFLTFRKVYRSEDKRTHCTGSKNELGA